MPEPLVSEDSDLRRLLDQVRSQPGAEILYQDVVRRGGVFGFFAREVHRVAYRIVEPGLVEPGLAEPTLAEPGLAEPGQVELGAAGRATTPTGQLPELTDLLASADALESSGDAGPQRLPVSAAEPAARPEAALQDFAALLRSLTDHDPNGADPNRADLPGADPKSAGLPGADPKLAEPVRAAHRRSTVAPKGNVSTFGKPDARARLELLMQLRQVGVPVSVNPRPDTHSLYEALENILEELPAPAVPPRHAGEVLAVVGESGPALQAARTCAAILRIPQHSIGVAGLPERVRAELDYPEISGRAEALRLRSELRRAELPSIVVIATDATEAGSDDPWAAELLAALRPTAVWAVVDARWKTEDSRAQLDRLGRVDALVVHSAQLSASPASVWDLDLPLGLLDGRAASTFAWTGLLFPLLRSGARHRASA